MVPQLALPRLCDGPPREPFLRQLLQAAYAIQNIYRFELTVGWTVQLSLARAIVSTIVYTITNGTVRVFVIVIVVVEKIFNFILVLFVSLA